MVSLGEFLSKVVVIIVHVFITWFVSSQKSNIELGIHNFIAEL